MQRICLFVFLLGIYLQGNAQSSVSINNNAAVAAPSAILDVSSINKGVLLPRMSSAQRKILPNPQAGLMVFDFDKSTFYLYDGFAWRPMAFTSEQQLTLIERTATPPVAGDKGVKLGNDVDIFGLYALAGAPGEAVGNNHEQGVAYIYYKDDGTWKLHQKIQAADGGVKDAFGSSVAMYNDLVAIGAPLATVNGVEYAGAVYIYKRNGAVWSMIKKIIPSVIESGAGFGSDVSLNNGKLVVAAPYKTINGLSSAGTVYFYEFVNNDWRLTKTFMPAAPVQHGQFGYSVKNFNNDVAIGYPFNKVDNKICGTVQVFSRNPNNSVWSEITVKPQIISENLSFGKAVDIYKDTLLVGAPAYESVANNTSYFGAGACYFFRKFFDSWAEMDRVYATETYSALGSAVAINGPNIIIGNPGHQNSGRVFIGPWKTTRFHQDVDRGENLRFGNRVAISGNNFIIGIAPKYDNMGAVQFGTIE